MWRRKRSRIASIILKEKNKVREFTLPNFKTFQVQYCGVVLAIEQTGKWNRIDSPETDPHKYSQLIFDQGSKAI